MPFQSGVDVMITIFGEKIGVFLKNQCCDQIFAQFSFVLSQKRQFFADFFGENIFKNQNTGPSFIGPKFCFKTLK
jgi:hypothetical protein